MLVVSVLFLAVVVYIFKKQQPNELALIFVTLVALIVLVAVVLWAYDKINILSAAFFPR